MDNPRVSDLTVDELMERIRQEMQTLIRETLLDVLSEVDAPSKIVKSKRPPLDLPVDDLGPWPEGLTLRREEMYDDDGR